MNVSSLLLTVGQAAGIGGIALGVLLLIFSDVVRRNIFPNLSQVQAYRIIRLIVVLTFAIAALGVAAWGYVVTRDPGPDRTAFYTLPPKLVLPDNDAKLNVFPRSIAYSWKPVEGATKYLLEVEYFDASLNDWKPLPSSTGRVQTDATNATTGFVGAQPGRWRVTAINVKNERGQSSEWRTFVYQQ